jgi:hypothetical protein
VLMPAAAGVDRGEFIRFNGSRERRRRTNTCVGPRFACGIDPEVPEAIPDSCREQRGPWTFFDFTSASCPLKHGYYVALYRRVCDTPLCSLEAAGATRGGQFGFLEASDPEEIGAGGYAAFRDGVLARNGASPFGSESLNRYVTSAGDSIEFRPLPSDLKTWAIHAINGVRQEARFSRWPLASGDVMTSDGKGLVRFVHPRTGERVVLDYRDPIRPRKAVSGPSR